MTSGKDVEINIKAFSVSVQPNISTKSQVKKNSIILSLTIEEFAINGVLFSGQVRTSFELAPGCEPSVHNPLFITCG